MKTKTEAKHTPTPWKIEESKYGIGVVGMDELGDGALQVFHIDDNGTPKLDRTNAAFIVRAVNSHEDMLDALKRAKRVVAESCGYNDGIRFHTDLLNDIEAAIAQAEGN